MKFRKIAVILICLSVLFISGCGEKTQDTSKSTDDFTQITTQSGEVKGSAQDGVAVFKGIPFAEPPVDELRFAPPQPVKPWKEVKECTEFAPAPPQMTQDDKLKMDEDCLYLNIWAPENAIKEADKKDTPVLVFIHGGAFAVGSTTQDIYDGEALARKGIICITVEYRLNATGFLASKEMEKEHGYVGNLGILDQIESLKWIKQNVGSFGGDSENITISGESAGSMSVSSLILSPMAEGLFQKAIMESGSVFGQNILGATSNGDLGQALQAEKSFKKAVKASSLADLRKTEIDTLVKNSAFSMDMTQPSPQSFMPVLDGKVIEKEPYKSLEEGNYNDVKVLTGYNTDEGSVFVPEDISEKRYTDFVKRIFGENADAYLERFPVDKKHTPTDRARQLVKYGLQIGCNIFGDTLSEQGKDVYLYQFDYHVPEYDKAGLGVKHGLELPFVFDSFPEGTELQEDGAAMIQQIQNYWVSFVKDGDPNTGSNNEVKWPEYEKKDSQILKLNSNTKAIPVQDAEDLTFITELLW